MAVAGARVPLGPAVTPPDAIDLGRIDIISGGAITSAALHALLRLPAVRADARVIEPERLDLSNLNRYPLARRYQCMRGEQKVDALAQWQHPGFAIAGVVRRFDDESLPELLPLADRILVGVDHIPSRWAVQRLRPRWLSVGATADFLTLTSAHEPGEPCAGCLHPADDEVNQVIPTVSFVSYWAGLLLATRLVRRVLGIGYAPSQQALTLWPLRLDRPYAALWQSVQRRPACPGGCGMPAA